MADKPQTFLLFAPEAPIKTPSWAGKYAGLKVYDKDHIQAGAQEGPILRVEAECRPGAPYSLLTVTTTDSAMGVGLNSLKAGAPDFQAQTYISEGPQSQKLAEQLLPRPIIDGPNVCSPSRDPKKAGKPNIKAIRAALLGMYPGNN
jgi:hypothetical protein